MPRQSEYTQEKATELLDDYVKPQECATTDLPREMKSELASTYIKDELPDELGPMMLERATNVVRFYVLRDRVDQLVGLLPDAEKTADDVTKSCLLIETICELGGAAQQRKASEHFDRMLADKVMEEDESTPTTIKTFFSLPPRKNTKPISERVTALRTRVEKNGPADQVWRFRECERRLLPWVIKEKGRKDWMLNMPDAPERLQRWAEAYLMFDMKTPFKWDEQAGFGLLRFARDEGDEAAVAALKAAMDRIDPKEDSPEAVKFQKTRGYAAREYFLEELEGSLRRDRDRNLQAQDDLIQ